MGRPLTFSRSEIASYHPLDLLHRVNPEIGSLAYADKTGLISPEIRPVIAAFRGLQSREKIEAIRAMSKKYGYDALIEIARTSQEGMTQRVELQEGGMTRRTELKETGMTQREKDKGRVLIELHKLKYDCARGIVQDHIDGQKYLSDNQLRAVAIEAQAHVEAVRFAESLRADTIRQVSRNDLEARIREAQLKHATILKQAEMERETRLSGDRKEIALAYIAEQARINQALISAQVEAEWAKTELGKTYLNTMTTLGREGIKVLGKSGKTRLYFKSTGPHGEMGFEVGLE